MSKYSHIVTYAPATPAVMQTLCRLENITLVEDDGIWSDGIAFLDRSRSRADPKKIIVVKKTVNPTIKVQLISHEICHHLMHHPSRGCCKENNRLAIDPPTIFDTSELFCDMFGLFMLMPVHDLFLFRAEGRLTYSRVVDKYEYLAEDMGMGPLLNNITTRIIAFISWAQMCKTCPNFIALESFR